MNRIRIKNIISLILVLIISTNSFAAVVSDNDGSAFITKAEYDSLKNNFQSQIDAYNTSIDSKIDFAIASYLSGIKVDVAPEDLLERIRNSMGEPWLSNKYSTGNNTITTQENITLRRHFTYKAYDNIKQTIYLQITDFYLKSGGYYFYTGNVAGTSTVSRWWWNIEYSPRTKVYMGSQTLSGSYCAAGDDIGSFFIPEDKTTSRVHQFDTDVVWPAIGWNRPQNGTEWSSVNFVNELTSSKDNALASTAISTDGDGSYYEYYISPSGKNVLRSFFTKAYPSYNVTLTAHTYKSFIVNNLADWRTYYTTETGMSDSTNLSYIIPAKTTYGVTTFGDPTKVVDGSEESIAYYGTQNIYQIQTDDGFDYGKFLVGKCENVNIYGVSTTANLTNTSQITIDKDRTKNTYIHNQCLITGQKGCDQNLSGCELKYTSVKSEPGTFKISDFVNEYVSGVAGETTYLGGGIPIIKTLKEDQNLNVKIKFKARTSEGIATGGQVSYVVSDKQFFEGNPVAGAKIYASGTATVGNEEDLTFKVDDKSNVWINFYSGTDGVDAAIDTMSVRVVN